MLGLKAAALADAAGDDAAVRRFLKVARAASSAKQNKAIDDWLATDAAARALVDGLGGDALNAALSSASSTTPAALSSSWSSSSSSSSSSSTQRYREQVKKARARPPKGTSFAVRRALADALVDERAGLDVALGVDRSGRAAAAQRLHRRLQALARPRSRDTGRLRALALELDAAVSLADVAAGDAGTDGVAAAARALFLADRLREYDVAVAKRDAAAMRYASALRTRSFCNVVEGPEHRHRISCDDVEAKAFGDVTFVDASRLPKGPFVADEANGTLADYDVLLQRCMKAGAKANLTTQSHVELEWGIDNGGRVRGLDLRPMRLRGTSVEDCVRSALEQFRYRPYPGEMQHQRLDFEIGGEL